MSTEQHTTEMPEDLNDKVAEFVSDARALIGELTQERDQALQKVAELESTKGQQKQAAVNGPDRDVVESTVDATVQAGFLKQADREQAIQAISDDPANAPLVFLGKLAARRIEQAESTVPTLGKSFKKEAGHTPTGEPVRESDKFFEDRFTYPA